VANKASQKSLSGKIFDGTWDIFVKHWKLLVALTAVQATLEFTLLNTVFKDVNAFLRETADVESLSDLLDKMPSDFPLYLTISFIIGMIMTGAFIGSLIAIIRDKQNVKFLHALRYGIDHFWELFSLAIVVGLIVIVGLSLLIVPGAIAAVLLMFSLHVRLDQELTIIDSMKESYRVVRADWKQLFFVVLGILGIAILANIAGSILSSSLSTSGTDVVALLLTIPTSAYMAVIFTKAYFVFKKVIKDSDK